MLGSHLLKGKTSSTRLLAWIYLSVLKYGSPKNLKLCHWLDTQSKQQHFKHSWLFNCVQLCIYINNSYDSHTWIFTINNNCSPFCSDSASKSGDYSLVTAPAGPKPAQAAVTGFCGRDFAIKINSVAIFGYFSICFHRTKVDTSKIERVLSREISHNRLFTKHMWIFHRLEVLDGQCLRFFSFLTLIFGDTIFDFGNLSNMTTSSLNTLRWVWIPSYLKGIKRNMII